MGTNALEELPIFIFMVYKKNEKIGSSETSVRISPSIRLHTSEDREFYTTDRDVLKSHTVINITGNFIWIKLEHDEFQWCAFVNLRLWCLHTGSSPAWSSYFVVYGANIS